MEGFPLENALPFEPLLHELLDEEGFARNGADFWKALCRYAHASPQTDASSMSEVLLQFEREYKRRTRETQMPTVYRSAKSIVLKALRHNVSYMDPNGRPLRKQCVSEECDKLR
jgi:hypothetical protein